MKYASLADGSLAIVCADTDVNAEWRKDDAGKVLGDPFSAAAQAQARIWIIDAEGLREGPPFPLLTPFPLVDRFPDGRWLVASARAGEEPNARVLSPDGDELSRIRLGDGIEHLKIDDADHIWVGWFDEGVFGNDGWTAPGLEGPPSCYGLAAFNVLGEIIARASDLPLDVAIYDCDALNVTADAAYACTYQDYPIIRMSVGEPPRWWRTDLSGTRAIAVSLPYLLAAGGFADEGDRAVLLRIGPETATILGQWRMPFQMGYPTSVDFADGRGPVLHAVNEGVWHQWQIEDFVASVA